MKKILILFLIMVPINVYALADNATSNVLMDFNTGTVIYESEKDKELAPASMTKMMSLLLIMENIDNGKLKLDDKVYITKNAAKMGGSQVYLEENTYMTVEALLRAICIASANDAVVAMAEHIGGSTSNFVKLMNEKAKKIGLKHTSFKNPHGLDESGHYSSAYDMALIARELIKHEKVLEYSSIYEDYIKHPNGKKTWIVNTNKLLNNYQGLDGLKTGFTDKSGYCITATAKKNDLRLISVVMNEESNLKRNQDTIELLNYGFSNYKVNVILDKRSDLGKIEILLGNKEYAKLKIKENLEELTNINEENKYTYKIIKNRVKAPISINDEVGKIILIENNKIIKDIPLYLEQDVKKANIFILFIRNIKKIFSGIELY